MSWLGSLVELPKLHCLFKALVLAVVLQEVSAESELLVGERVIEGLPPLDGDLLHFELVVDLREVRVEYVFFHF